MTNEQLAELLALDKSSLPPDGGSRFNRLIFARSPYLLQHATNPVDWYEWGDEAFAEARRRDVPLLVSIGYATCHWCHVMAAESFSDPTVAARLNDGFIAIKVDREERPDIDEYCMTAARTLTGGGGWPLNLFMGHDRRPFFAITYLPKLPRHRTPGFLDLLTNLTTLWQKQRSLVETNAGQLATAMAEADRQYGNIGKPAKQLTDEALQQLAGMFDRQHGGFGLAVKFPMPVYLLFLLQQSGGPHDAAADMALATLATMARSGINDQLGGGFHRYAVDRQWQVPHFEKMLYDQALLITCYCRGYRLSHDPALLETAVATAGFVTSELRVGGNGFAAGLDADSGGAEGLFYTWTRNELENLLGSEAGLATAYWSVTPAGELDGRSPLHSQQSAAAFADGNNIPLDRFTAMVRQWRQLLLAARSGRERPLCDQKVILGWNGLLIEALVELAAATGDRNWLNQAEMTAAFIVDNMSTPTGRLVRTWLHTPGDVPAFAEDYAFFCLALARLAETADQDVWRKRLDYYVGEMVRLFVGNDGSVSWTGADGEKMPLELPPLQDNVMPGAVGSCAAALLQAGRILAAPDHAALAGKIVERYQGIMTRGPAGCLSLLQVAGQLEHGQG